MREMDVQPMDLFSYILLEQHVSIAHPLRAIPTMVDRNRLAIVKSNGLRLRSELFSYYRYVKTVGDM